MMLLTEDDKIALRLQTEKLMQTYNEIKHHFATIDAVQARRACEAYGWFEKLRPELAQQIVAFKKARDLIFKIDGDAADLYDRAVEMNRKTLTLIEGIVKKARIIQA